MPRPRKAHVGDIVRYREDADASLWGWGVVVGYRQDGRGRGEYRLVRSNRPMAGQIYGRTFWVKSFLVERTGSRYKRAFNVVKANDRLGLGRDRGCSCNCCAHVALSVLEVKRDGTMAWEAAFDEGGDAD